MPSAAEGTTANALSEAWINFARCVADAWIAGYEGGDRAAMGPLFVHRTLDAIDGRTLLQLTFRPEGLPLSAGVRIELPPRRPTAADPPPPPASHLLKEGERLSDVVAEVGLSVKLAIARHGCAHPATLLDLGVHLDTDTAVPAQVYAELAILGHDLVRRPTSLLGRDRRAVAKLLEAVLEAHARRSRMLGWLQADGASGWTDQAAMQALSAAGIGLQDALSRLRREARLRLELPSGAAVELAWHDGQLCSGFVDRSAGLTMADNSLVCDRCRLVADASALVGRRLSEVVDHPLVPGDAIITYAKPLPAGTQLFFLMPLIPVVGEAGPEEVWSFDLAARAPD